MENLLADTENSPNKTGLISCSLSKTNQGCYDNYVTGKIKFRDISMFHNQKITKI